MQPLELAAQLGAVLDEVDVPWVLGGSLASSLIGEPRSTMDVDLAVRLDRFRLARFLARLGDGYYVPVGSAGAAVDHHESFNLIHLASGVKVDMYVLGDGLLDRRQIERRTQRSIEVGGVAVVLWVGAAEDQVLRKLCWYRLGGEVSDRQWRDVVMMLRVQGDRLDLDDLTATADELGLADLLARAQAEAGS
jgi:hypothetical protein